MIYFIQAGKNGPIKIGYSASNAEERRRFLQVGHYARLVLLGCLDGTVNAEKALHKKFSAAHIRGEWFKPTEEILGYLASQPHVPSCELGSRVSIDRDIWRKNSVRIADLREKRFRHHKLTGEVLPDVKPEDLRPDLFQQPPPWAEL